MAYPKELRASEISQALKDLVYELGERLLSGATPIHAELRRQLSAARIDRVTLTGAGLYADFALPPDLAPVEPREMIGGEVLLHIEGLDAAAGSLPKVKDGKLAFVEVYAYGNASFPDEPRVLSFGETFPLPISTGPANER